MDIELPMIRASCLGFCHKRRPPVYWHQGEHWIPSIGGVVREVNSREQLFEQAAGKDSNLDMLRLVNIVGSRDTSWFNGLKVTTTFFIIRQASKARAFGIGADILVATVIAALGVGLPELDHGVRYGQAFAIEDAAAQPYALAFGSGGCHDRDRARVHGQAEMKKRANRL